MKKYLSVFVLLAVLITTAGWVRRTIQIDSQPQGAQVYFNRVLVGKTPCTHEFSNYGKYHLELVKEGYANYRTVVNLKGPLYEYFPLSFFSEVLVPWKIKNDHYFTYTLEQGQTKKPIVALSEQAQPPIAPVQLETVKEKALSE